MAYSLQEIVVIIGSEGVERALIDISPESIKDPTLRDLWDEARNVLDNIRDLLDGIDDEDAEEDDEYLLGEYDDD